jgi:hypothetical protein
VSHRCQHDGASQSLNTENSVTPIPEEVPVPGLHCLFPRQPELGSVLMWCECYSLSIPWVGPQTSLKNLQLCRDEVSL